MRGPHYHRILASTALALILAAPLAAMTRDLDIIPGQSATRLAPRQYIDSDRLDDFSQTDRVWLERVMGLIRTQHFLR